MYRDHISCHRALYLVDVFIKFKSTIKAPDKNSEALFFVYQENKPYPIETPTLKDGLFCIGSYPKFIDGPK